MLSPFIHSLLISISILLSMGLMSWAIYTKRLSFYKRKIIYFNIFVAIFISSLAVIFRNNIDLLLLIIFITINYLFIFYKPKALDMTQEMYNFMTMHDHLTQLPNRRSLNQYIDENANEHVAFLHINLDRFKLINNVFGYQQADMLLTLIAQRLQLLIHDKMRLFRISGDELLLIIEENEIEKAICWAEQILQVLQQPFDIEHKNIFITSSIGIAISPKHGKTLQELLIHADTAMIQAKKQGRNNYHVYNANLVYEFEHLSQKILNDLYTAHQKKQLVLHYQAKFNLESEQICGVEALLRWEHPDDGLLYPKDFISIAEKIGVIIPMTYWVLEEACRQIQQWKQQNMTHFFPIAINISNLVFEQEKLLYYTEQFIQKYNVQANELAFEITESAAMRSIEKSQKICHQLHQMGVKILIDDFGMGYSNFMYLRDLMIDELKIDRSFVQYIEQNDKNKIILQHIIELAKQLNLTATVEGVETAQQMEILKQLSCPCVQGFYLAKPMPLKKLQQTFKK